MKSGDARDEVPGEVLGRRRDERALAAGVQPPHPAHVRLEVPLVDEVRECRLQDQRDRES